MLLLSVAIFAALLVVWGIAWRSQTRIAFGILIGLGLGTMLAPFIGPFNSLDELPIWLPATPLISVVMILFVLGSLAWRAPEIGGQDSDD